MMENVQEQLDEFDMAEDDFDAMLADSEPAEIVGPPEPVREVRFELISGSLRSYRWRLVAENGEILATSATSYRSPEDVRRALSTLTIAVRNAPVVDAREEASDLRDAG